MNNFSEANLFVGNEKQKTKMDNLKKKHLGMLMMEILWWVITAIAAYTIAKPLWANFIIHNFIHELIMFIIIFITYMRYLFGLKYTFLAYAQKVKFFLIFFSFPLLMYLIQTYFGFQDFLEKQNEGMIEFKTYFREGLTFDEHYSTITYLTKFYTFFGMCSIIAVLFSPFRLLLSYWRVYNKTGTV